MEIQIFSMDGEPMSQSTRDELLHTAEVTLGVTDENRCNPQSGVRVTLTPSALTAWQIKDVITAIIAAGLPIGFAFLPFAPEFARVNLFGIVLICLTPSIVEVLVLNSVRHRRYSLRVFPERLVIRRGWIFRQVITIPRSSVLNLRLRRGPVLRRLGLTSVSVLTIADQHTLGPLDDQQKVLVEAFVSGGVV